MTYKPNRNDERVPEYLRALTTDPEHDYLEDPSGEAENIRINEQLRNEADGTVAGFINKLEINLSAIDDELASIYSQLRRSPSAEKRAALEAKRMELLTARDKIETAVTALLKIRRKLAALAKLVALSPDYDTSMQVHLHGQGWLREASTIFHAAAALVPEYKGLKFR